MPWSSSLPQARADPLRIVVVPSTRDGASRRPDARPAAASGVPPQGLSRLAQPPGPGRLCLTTPAVWRIWGLQCAAGGLGSVFSHRSRVIRFPGAAGQACYAPEGPQGALGQAVRASGGQPRAARQCGSFGGSAIQRKQDPFSSLLMAARDLGSRPPIAAEVGRDRLTSVGREPTPRTASGGQNASGGGHLIGVPLRRTARPLVDHYPRTKSEDDAVGAPRLVLRRWDTTVVPRRVPPAPMRSKCPKGRGRVPRPASQLEVLVGRAGDESVRQ